jgi:hypothetical protein
MLVASAYCPFLFSREAKIILKFRDHSTELNLDVATTVAVRPIPDGFP